ncbi:zinc finger, C3HC4 type [Oesophagostomum dentatum]|uniref:Zinc finger, C3HC4 type n=1 Tax=Oesophagostomum dentatum TaxID=61180 RepID=A0A0B1T3F1_OESDE|nr:zinc finger, C3HC4 type [Oesophagostomum dentatum]
MSSVRGRCVICTCTFISNNIAALQCGHTFHFDCVSKWIERSKTCPNCRVRTTERQIIKHLFFDAPDDLNATQLPASSELQVEALSIALEKEKTCHLEVQEELLKLKDTVSSLQAKLDREKARFLQKVPSLEARNRQLEMMLINQEELEKTLERTRARLKACEFYKAVTTGKDENAMDKYIRDDGSVETGQFLSILRRQLEESRKQQISLADDLRTEREHLRASKKKENELKKFIKVLERELQDVRAAANMSTSTPFNPRLKGLIPDQSPQKRSSLGFNDTVDFNEDVVASALKHHVKPVPIPVHEKAGPSEITRPIFSDSSDEENSTSCSAANVSLQYPAALDKIASPRVPKTLRERVMARSENARLGTVGSAHHAAEKALEKLELRNISAAGVVRRPLLKRKNDNSASNQRLSQFFHKKSKSTEIISLD